MHPAFPRLAAPALALALATSALASLRSIQPPGTAEADGRTFEYGGHISYQLGSGMGMSFLTILTHNNSNCGSGQCGGDPHLLMKCRIASGAQDYPLHVNEAEVFADGVYQPGSRAEHQHDHLPTMPGWVYKGATLNTTSFSDYLPTTWKWKITFYEDGGGAVSGNDVVLD